MQIVDVEKYYKKFLALKGVSLSVQEGEFLTILGPSGSGKTTLLKLIAGFETLSKGAIYLSGENISKKKVYERNIGMVFQNYALFPNMTVYENISYPLRIRKYSKKEIEIQVDRVLKIIQLDDLKSRYPNQLSGGQQQRVALARAIVFNPPLLLLDEPLSALDKNLREHMQLEIKHIQAQTGITTINVTHDQKEALTMSDRICVMNEGSIEQIDTPKNIYKFPNSKFVAQFIGEINLIKCFYVEMSKNEMITKSENGSFFSIKMDSYKEEWKNNPILIALRPENIRIVSEQGSMKNTCKARVVESIYMGESLKVILKTELNSEIVMVVPASLAEKISVDNEIIIGWNPEDATIILDDDVHTTIELKKELV